MPMQDESITTEAETLPPHSCEECGRPEAQQVADRFLCLDCLSEYGSSCSPGRETGNELGTNCQS